MLQVVVAYIPFAVLLARLTVPFSPAAFGARAGGNRVCLLFNNGSSPPWGVAPLSAVCSSF